MSKFIKVTGEDDYSAMVFEQSDYTVEEIYKEMIENDVTTLKKTIADEEGYECEVEFDLYEFEDVDENFVEFVKDNLCDYDALKATNIYRVQ